ncbi:ki-ras-induced actin-interacting protein-IP3R-interacting domain olf186-M [Cochliomyia hominivorax]
MERKSLRSEYRENSPNSSCENILKIVEQQKQQIKTKTLETQKSTHTSSTTTLMSLKTIQNLSAAVPPPATPTSCSTQRKKRLQRQKSTVYSGDETEYAADLEEEEDDEEDEGYGRNEREASINLPPVSNLTNQKKKQVRFRNKQQSESSLKLMNQHVPIEKTFSSSSLTSSLNSSVTSGSVGSHERRLKSDGSFDSISELPHCSGLLQRQKCILKRDNSVHSDSSRYSSVDSLLEARKPDPEAILINLGFGPVGSEDILSRIPKRFLKPSQVRGIDTEAFIKRLQLANTLADHSVLGYRGLTGNPDIPPSHIVAKIMERFEVNERKKSLTSMELKLR